MGLPRSKGKYKNEPKVDGWIFCNPYPCRTYSKIQHKQGPICNGLYGSNGTWNRLFDKYYNLAIKEP